MFKNKYSNFLTIILIISIISILVVIGIIGYNIYKKYKLENEALHAISEFDAELQKDVEEEEAINEAIETIDSEVSNTANSTRKKHYKNYVMLGYIEIKKTNIKYPILEKYTPNALDIAVAVLYPTNPRLNESGNTVIIGHNYRNGTLFSNNKKLTIGDKINITNIQGKKLTYTIYEIFETTPEDTIFYNRDTQENIEITLSTCTDDGNARLIILARVE